MNAICNNCPGYAGCALNPDGMPCKRRRKELGYHPTNADRTRTMSVEELAAYGVHGCIPYGCTTPAWYGHFRGYADTKEEAIRREVDWLTQPAQEE